MHRRQFLKTAAAVPLVSAWSYPLRALTDPAEEPVRRVRPGDPAWPTDATWDRLKREVGGGLIKLEDRPRGGLTRELTNPYYVGDQPALTQSSGWLDAWTSAPSVYAVAAATATDVVAAVNFARKHNLRLVVKGGGHSYQGTSNSADSLLIWTRHMNRVEPHDSFVPQGCKGKVTPQAAVSVEAGAMWMHVYDVVTTQTGRYVQGGGCATVGVAGLIQSGGFGSFSKKYGLAAAGLLEAEVVTADGVPRIANACTHPDLFWALKGGGGGSFGVVTRLTLRTRELPQFFGAVFGTIKAGSDAACRSLTARVTDFYRERLYNPHWGEQIRFKPDNTVEVGMVFQGLNQQQAEAEWRPILDWVANSSNGCTWEAPLRVIVIPARHFWDPAFLRKNAAPFIVEDGRPGAPEGNIFWRGDQEQVGVFWHGYRSAWLSASLLRQDRRRELADALFKASRSWEVSLHFNKGLAGAPEEDIAAAKDTATNPAVVDAFALAIIAGGGPPAFSGMPAPKPDLAAARRHAGSINQATDELLTVAGPSGSYVSESDFFESAWQRSYWGPNYARLAAVKQKYDPHGLFFVHHGVGSEHWSPDGFTKLRR
jgi:FAD/FMN-containing dehydrogenase